MADVFKVFNLFKLLSNQGVNLNLTIGVGLACLPDCDLDLDLDLGQTIAAVGAINAVNIVNAAAGSQANTPLGEAVNVMQMVNGDYGALQTLHELSHTIEQAANPMPSNILEQVNVTGGAINTVNSVSKLTETLSPINPELSYLSEQYSMLNPVSPAIQQTELLEQCSLVTISPVPQCISALNAANPNYGGALSMLNDAPINTLNSASPSKLAADTSFAGEASIRNVNLANPELQLGNSYLSLAAMLNPIPQGIFLPTLTQLSSINTLMPTVYQDMLQLKPDVLEQYKQTISAMDFLSKMSPSQMFLQSNALQQLDSVSSMAHMLNPNALSQDLLSPQLDLINSTAFLEAPTLVASGNAVPPPPTFEYAERVSLNVPKHKPLQSLPPAAAAKPKPETKTEINFRDGFIKMLTEIVQQDAEPADAPAETPTETAPAVVAKPAPKELTLVRELSADDGTFGTLQVDGQIFQTLELPWCIPAGKYTVVACKSSKKFDYDHYRILDAKGREQGLIHIGEYAGDTSKGYKKSIVAGIMIGKGREYVDVNKKQTRASVETGSEQAQTLTQQALTESSSAFAELQKQINKDIINLAIISKPDPENWLVTRKEFNANIKTHDGKGKDEKFRFEDEFVKFGHEALKRGYEALNLLVRINKLRDQCPHKMRPIDSYWYADYASPRTAGEDAHYHCTAIDIEDKDQKICNWLMENLEVLEACGLWWMHPVYTPSWVHLQTCEPTWSKDLVFDVSQKRLHYIPNSKPEADPSKLTDADKNWLITREKFNTGIGVFSGEDRTPAKFDANTFDLLQRVDIVMKKYKETHSNEAFKINSSYRSVAYNKDVAKGAANSHHCFGRAIDIDDDSTQTMTKWMEANLDILVKAGLWMEARHHTNSWCHLQSRPSSSGNRIFAICNAVNGCKAFADPEPKDAGE